MTSKPLLLLFALLIGGALYWLFVGGDGATHAPGPSGPSSTTTDGPAAVGVGAASTQAAGGGSREQLSEPSAPGAELLQDPAIAGAMTGFIGRLVTVDGAPVPDGSLQMYRGALDSVIDVDTDPFQAAEMRVSIRAGDARSDADGRFEIGGVWPNGIYALRADVDTQAHHGSAWQLVDRVPDPGQTVDLGDVVLNRTGVMVGRVVDEDGQPLAGATVRAADVPGQVVGFVPFEWFDPDGGVIVRESGGPVAFTFPPVVKRLMEDFPIAQGVTAADGSFRLGGLVPGPNLFTARLQGLKPEVRPTVRVKANEVTDFGDVALREGEEIFGRVVDAQGQPVAGVEVLAGPTSLAVPFDFATSLGVTNGQGEFSSLGFPPGRFTAAARRGPGQPWVRTEPGPVEQDVEIVFGASRSLAVRIEPKGVGLDPAAAELRLVAGRANGSVETVVFGLVEPFPSGELRGSSGLRRLEDGSYLATGLQPSRYTVIMRLAGAADLSVEADLREDDKEVVLHPEPARRVVVHVFDPRKEGLRNAKVAFVTRRGNPGGSARYRRPVREMPTDAGRTDAKGSLSIAIGKDSSAQVVASHPAYGTVHGDLSVGQDQLVLQMQQPGSIDGVLLRRGQPVKQGEFSIACVSRDVDDGLGATPRLGSSDAEGRFSFGGLQPGRFRIEVVPPLREMFSAREFAKTTSLMSMSSDLPGESVVVVSGAAAELVLDVDPNVDGPVAYLRGTLRLNDVPTPDIHVRWWPLTGSPRTVVSDHNGRYDFGEVKAGPCTLTVRVAGEGELFDRGIRVYHSEFTMDVGAVREHPISIELGEVEVIVKDQAGAPVPDVFVSLGFSGERTDSNGVCRFELVPVGGFTADVRVRGKKRVVTQRALGRGIAIRGIKVPIELVLQATHEIQGRVDMSAFGTPPPSILVFAELEGRRVGSARVGGDGAFKLAGLPSGRIKLTSYSLDDSKAELAEPLIEVQGDMTGVVLVLRRPEGDGG